MPRLTRPPAVTGARSGQDSRRRRHGCSNVASENAVPSPHGVHISPSAAAQAAARPCAAKGPFGRSRLRPADALRCMLGALPRAFLRTKPPSFLFFSATPARQPGARQFSPAMRQAKKRGPPAAPSEPHVLLTTVACLRQTQHLERHRHRHRPSSLRCQRASVPCSPLAARPRPRPR